jgi:phosphoserine phosphatase RsbU/P
VVPNLPGELAEAIVGALFVAIGLASLAAGLAARPRRALIAVWFGVFSLLYGVRLAARSDLIQAATGWSDAALAFTEAFITYAMPVPSGLFSETLTTGHRRQIVRRTWQMATLYVVAGVLNDLVRGRPGATLWLNAPVVLTTITIYLWQVIAGASGRGRWSTDVRIVAAAGALFTAAAFHETVFQRAPLGVPFSLEPFAMLVLTLALGWFVLSRVGRQAADYSALSRELRLAREIQESLLPRQMPEVPGLRLTGVYLPMSAVAGDFYDVIVRPDATVVVIVADVSGHGVPAALVASMVKVAFAAEAERESRPGAILEGINRTLIGKFDRAYVTACCVAIDAAGTTLSYAAAGHPPAMLRRRNGTVERNDTGGFALTLLPAATYPTANIPFLPGDRLLLFTDGVLESARPGRDEFFGDAELERVVRTLKGSASATDVVLAAHRQWIGPETPLSDDVTMVAIEKLTIDD